MKRNKILADHFSHLSSKELTVKNGFDCGCGRHHGMHMKYLDIGKGAADKVPEAVLALGCKKPMVLCDKNTYEALGRKVSTLLSEAGIEYYLFIIPCPEGDKLEPNEYTVGSAVLNFDQSCDLVIAVGSGVINDTARVLSTTTKVPQLTVGTAPSMDGYASASSSMVVNNVKQTLPLKAPEGLILDTDVLSEAPMKMLCAGLGDMLGKYTALCEWKLAALFRDENYCEEIASLMENSLCKVTENAKGLKARDQGAVEAVTEGLVNSGIAMAFLGNSRPASGQEHYFSHCWEMFALDRGKTYELHGLQVGLGTLYTVTILDKLKDIKPSMDKVMGSASSFDENKWENEIKRVFGNTAGEILALEDRLKQNDAEGRIRRAASIVSRWDEAVKIISESIPSPQCIYDMMKDAGIPTRPEDIGVSKQDVLDAFVYSRNIRDKYLLSSMVWDIGYMDEMREHLEKALDSY